MGKLVQKLKKTVEKEFKQQELVLLFKFVETHTISGCTLHNLLNILNTVDSTLFGFLESKYATDQDWYSNPEIRRRLIEAEQSTHTGALV